MANEHKLRSGYRVAGPNTSDGNRNIWTFPTLELAQNFAREMAQRKDDEYDVYKYLGSVRRVYTYPTEWIPSSD